MSSFTNATSFEPVRQLNKWKVTKSFAWYLEQNGNVVVEIPNGYIFNGADIPFPFSIRWPRVHPDYIQSACLHDYCLEYMRHLFSREEIDKMFYQSLLVLGNSKVRAWCMYNAVRAYGILTERNLYFDIII